MAAGTIASPAAGRRSYGLLSPNQRSTLLRALTMGIYVVITVFPFYWMFITAFKENADLYELKNNPLIFNQPPTLSHIDYLFTRTLFGQWMLNSLIIGLAVVLITLLIATPAGYTLPFGRIDLVGIQLEIYGPNPTAKNKSPGIDTVLKRGRALGPGSTTTGDNQAVNRPRRHVLRQHRVA